MSTDSSSNPAYLNPVALTQRLVRFDTTNPPGNEVQCIEPIKALLDDAGIAEPLLLQGHIDVVPATQSGGSIHPLVATW